MSRGGGINGIISRLTGQSERTQTTLETQVGIPNASSWSALGWRCFWCFAGYFAFPLVFSLLWKVFDLCRDTLFREYYSLFWLPPNPFVFWFGWWELLALMCAVQVYPVAKTAAYRHWRETRHPNHPAPSKAIHPMEATELPGQMPNQFEADLYAEQSIQAPPTPTERHRHEFQREGKGGGVDNIDEEWENHAGIIAFAQAVHGGKNFSVTVSRDYGVTPTDYDKLKDWMISRTCFHKRSIAPKKTLRLMKKGNRIIQQLADTPIP